MNPRPLLDDVFREQVSGDLRDRLFTTTFRAARRRLWRRRLALLALPAAAIIVAWLAFWPRPTLAPESALSSSALSVVSSNPLPESMIVRTRSDRIQLIAIESAAVSVFTTSGGDRTYQNLTDEQLLALVSGRTAAIVRDPFDARQARLLVLEPEGSTLSLP